MLNYRMFMQDYLSEAISAMKQYVGEDASFEEWEEWFMEEDEEGKEVVYKENYYFRDNLQKAYVSDVLAKPKTQRALIDFTGRFMDDHATQLSTSGPVHMFTFGDKETSYLYEMFNITPDRIIEIYNEVVKETYFGKISAFITGWITKAPHKLLITAILIDAVQNNYKDIITCCEYLWAFAEYPIIYRGFWKTGVKEEVMNYTIEHLGSKFKVKKVNNLQELLYYDAHSAVSFFIELFKKGADNVYVDFMRRMRNQMKNTFKNIAIAYYKNDEENATQHSKAGTFEDDTVADQEGLTTNTAQVIDATVNKFSTGDINQSIVRISADNSQVDKGNLSGFIAQIYATKNNKLPKLVEDVITSYFERNPTNTSVSSTEFLNFGLSLYRSIGTSKDPIYQEIRSILNYWMYDIIDIRSHYNREATIINYTRAIFNYVILMINYYN